MSPFDKPTFLMQFRELYEGVPPGSPTWFVSNTPDSGVFGTIDRLDARKASAVPLGTLSVAAHAEHLRWSLDYALAFFRGEHPSPDWSGSWSVREVDEEAWSRLKRNLRANYEAISEAVQEREDWSDDGLRAGTMALVAHGAYHLGAIRLLAQDED